MKKLFLPLLISLLTPALTGCLSSEGRIIAINNADGEEITYVELTTSQLENLINSKQDFGLEFYTEWCGHCQDLKELLDNYVINSRKVMYRFNMEQVATREEFNELQAKYPQVFVDEYVPAIRYFSKGKLTYDVNANKFQSYAALEKVLNKRYIKSYVSLITKSFYYNEYIKEHSRCIGFAYDLDNPVSLKVVAEQILTQDIINTKTDIILLNRASVGGYFDFVIKNYKLGTETFCVEYNNTNITKIADYSASDFSFKDFIS